MKDFVNYNQALELKELGFNEPCLAVFNDSKQSRINSESRNWNDNVKNGDTTSAPLFQQAFRFFREKYGLYVFEDHRCNSNIDINSRTYWMGIKQFKLAPFGSSVLVGVIELGCYKTYEEAESACLDKLIELAKNVKLK